MGTRCSRSRETSGDARNDRILTNPATKILNGVARGGRLVSLAKLRRELDESIEAARHAEQRTAELERSARADVARFERC